MNTVVIVCSWIAYLAYTFCMIPQIVTNYHRKSGAGVGRLFLFLTMVGQAVCVYYVFFLNLPLAYKICSPLQLLLTCVLIAQRLWYSKNLIIKVDVLPYVGGVMFLLLLLPWGWRDPYACGNWCGAMMVVLGAFGQAPQAFKLWRERSVVGFNKNYIYVLCLAEITDLIAAVLGGLPIQTKISAVRVLVYCAIFLWQFNRYSGTHARPD